MRDFAAMPYEYLDEMAILTDAEYGRLMRALGEYSRSGRPIELTGNERFFAQLVMIKEDQHKEEFCDVAEAGRRGGLAKAAKRRNEKLADGYSPERADSPHSGTLPLDSANIAPGSGTLPLDSANIPLDSASLPLDSAKGGSAPYCTPDMSRHNPDMSYDLPPSNFSLSTPALLSSIFLPTKPTEDTNNKNTTTISAELPPRRASAPVVTVPSLPGIPLNNGNLYFVSREDFDKWSKLYPAVDVAQEIRNMVGWSDANPSKRKTVRGVKRFITAWLARTQDRAGSGGYQHTGGRREVNTGGYRAQEQGPGYARDANAAWNIPNAIDNPFPDTISNPFPNSNPGQT